MLIIQPTPEPGSWALLIVGLALLSLGGLLQYFVFIYLWVIGVFPPYESLELQAAAYACIVGPLLLGVVIARRRVLRPGY